MSLLSALVSTSGLVDLAIKSIAVMLLACAAATLPRQRTQDHGSPDASAHGGHAARGIVRSRWHPMSLDVLAATMTEGLTLLASHPRLRGRCCAQGRRADLRRCAEGDRGASLARAP